MQFQELQKSLVFFVHVLKAMQFPNYIGDN